VYIWIVFELFSDAFITKVIPFDHVLTFGCCCSKLINLGKGKNNGVIKNVYESNVKLN
jgi:hypothetical protein